MSKNKIGKSVRLLLIDLLTPVFRELRKMGLLPARPLINDRAHEYSFAIRYTQPVSGKKVLDVGYLESPMPFILDSLGAEVFGIDIRPCPINYGNINFVVGDIRKTEFSSREFDIIYALSTVEHLGIKTRYNSYDDLEADSKALNEMERILKPGGSLILTVPFGRRAIDSVQRTYDYSQIMELVKNWEILAIDYVKDRVGYWDKSTKEEAEDTTGYHANILLALRKSL